MGLKPGAKYTGIDLYFPPEEIFENIKQAAEEKNIEFNFIAQNDMLIDFEEEIDTLFIDSLHTYCHLTYELEKFSPFAKKYICLHDTSFPWGNTDEPYSGDFSEYPEWIDKTKRGLWPAVQDFLKRHPEWKLYERKTNNSGFTTLTREKIEIGIYPISFSFPLYKVCSYIPQKTTYLSPLIPGNPSTYIYNTEQDYYKQYQESFFALTIKKGGWDTLRTLEIIANRCIPVFPEFDKCPLNTLWNYPRELFRECILLYNEGIKLGKLDQNFILKYINLNERLFEWFMAECTTIKNANYISSKTGINPDSKILYISNGSPDYMSITLLHGLKSLYGKNVIDFPKLDFMYDTYQGDTNTLYGKGFSYTKLLIEKDYYDNSYENWITVKKLILEHFFDYVIFGCSSTFLFFENSVIMAYQPNEIIYINGSDDELSAEKLIPRGHTFVRELV